MTPGPRTRLRWAVGARLVDYAQRLEGRYRRYIPLECPPSAADRPRYGHGRPPHAQLHAMVSSHTGTYRRCLEEISPYVPDLARIPRRAPDAVTPHWDQGFLPGLDAAVLYGLVRRHAPARYLEVGSGNSTKFVARARSDGGLSTSIISIDPAPVTEVDSLCDTVVRQPLESADLSEFGKLRAGDILFVDDSHRVFMNSDVVTFFLDILPNLPEGLLLGIHDIFLPDDYLPDWGSYYLSEQYLLASYLLGGGARLHPVLACWYATNHPDLSRVLEPLWSAPSMAGAERRGWAFWFRIGA